MEELEKNETSTQAEENTVSLASAQALADALAKIEAYTPTTWVDNSSPDIDAEHLNKPEQAIKRVTDALNSAVDVIKDLQSQVTKNAGDISTVNNNLSNKFKNTADNGYTQLSQLMDVGAWNKPFVFDIPYTSSLAPASNNAVGIAERGMLHAFDYAGKHFYCIDASKGWQESPYALKSDLLRISRTYISGDSYADAKNLSIPPGIYSVGPDFKNIPETTYGFLEIVADSISNWRLIKFIPTNIKSYYLMFYNGYDKTWSGWAHFRSVS